jgi:acyl-CoA thioester hydrolase
MSEYTDTVVRVRYAETDQMGVVYYANYYVYAEIGRVEYMRDHGVSYKQMELEDDTYIYVAESKCRYLNSARYDDPVRIRTRVASFNRRTLRFTFEIFQHETGDLLAVGETVHIVCNKIGTPKSLPDKYRKYFGGDPAEAEAEQVK